MPSWKMSVANFEMRADVAAADVDPVHHHHHEADQQSLPQTVGMDRRVHGDVVEMLADGAGIVGDDHVAVVQIVPAVELQPVLHRGAHDVGDEHRHAGRALADEVAVRVDDADRIVLVFVDVGAERRARDVDVDLVGDGDQAPPDHLDGDRIERLGCAAKSPADCVNGCSQCRSPRACRW